MTATLRKHGYRGALSFAALAIVVGLTFLLPVAARPMSERGVAPREIVIVVRDMAFYVDGQSSPNPPIRVRAGERVVLTLRNEEAGMTHDFAIDEWSAATRSLRGLGADRMVITAPDRRGTTSYVCRPHAAVMRGLVVVE